MSSKTSTSANKAASEQQQAKDAPISSSKQEPTTLSSSTSAPDSNKDPESLLKEYSKELYVYTLDLLNSVRIDNAHKGVNGKAYVLKRTISDIAVPLKTMGIASDASKGTKGAVAPA